MSNLLRRLITSGKTLMCAVYSINLLASLAHAYVLGFTDYFSRESTLLIVVHACGCGFMLVIHFLLLKRLLHPRNSTLTERIWLLMLSIFGQIFRTVIDVTYAAINGEFWHGADILILFTALSIVICLYRLYVVTSDNGKKANALTERGDQNE